MRKTLRAPFIVVCAALAARDAAARPDDYRVNVREGCRQEIAGAYLEAYDAKERAADYARALAEQMKSLGDALKGAHARLAKARADAEGHAFETDRAAALDRAAAEARTLEQQLAETSRLHAGTISRIEDLTSKERDLRRRIETVFALQRVEDKPDGGYPFRVDYRAPCPKYRYVCALPREDAAKLEKLEINGALPDQCRKYVDLSRLR